MSTTPSQFEQIRNLFLLRTQPPDGEPTPFYTTGSIVSAALLRATVVFLAALWFARDYRGNPTFWTLVVFALWGLVAYPAWKQYASFGAGVQQIVNDTLCGSCTHFSPSNQLCSLYDEHVSTDSPLCDGIDWQPRS
jgi:hypothetical protein